MNDANQPQSLARRAAMIAAVVGATLGVAQPAHSAPPVHVAFPVDLTYEVPELTELCRVEVWFSMVGTFKGTLVREEMELEEELELDEDDDEIEDIGSVLPIEVTEEEAFEAEDSDEDEDN